MASLPKMTEVFVVHEVGSTAPPPGATPVTPDQWVKLGPAGKAAQVGLDALKQSGQDADPYVTPEGEFLAFPKMNKPGATPLRADLSKGGIWTPLDGEEQH